MNRSIWLGWDSREEDAYSVARRSIHACAPPCPWPQPLRAAELRKIGMYTRPEEMRDSVRWDLISDAPMSTEHAVARFFTPLLAGSGWALFMDSDIMVRADLGELFALADPQYAVQVVQHRTYCTGPHASGIKMDGQPQLSYRCKNWSSVMLFNCDHPANRALTIDHINTVPGRDLHAFDWLPMNLIGSLPATWNHLVGIDAPDNTTSIAHFTLGIPSMPGYENCEFAEEWRGWL